VALSADVSWIVRVEGAFKIWPTAIAPSTAKHTAASHIVLIIFEL
jgi:hypothetical protein